MRAKNVYGTILIICLSLQFACQSDNPELLKKEFAERITGTVISLDSAELIQKWNWIDTSYKTVEPTLLLPNNPNITVCDKPDDEYEIEFGIMEITNQGQVVSTSNGSTISVEGLTCGQFYELNGNVIVSDTNGTSTNGTYSSVFYKACCYDHAAMDQETTTDEIDENCTVNQDHNRESDCD